VALFLSSSIAISNSDDFPVPINFARLFWRLSALPELSDKSISPGRRSEEPLEVGDLGVILSLASTCGEDNGEFVLVVLDVVEVVAVVEFVEIVEFVEVVEIVEFVEFVEVVEIVEFVVVVAVVVAVGVVESVVGVVLDFS